MGWPLTMGDDQEWMRAHTDRPADAVGPLRHNTLVRAPCCGVVMPADCVEDYRTVPLTVFRAGNRHAAMDHDGACGGCRALMLLTDANGWTPSSLARAQGAPEDAVRFLRAREIAEAAVRTAVDAGLGADPTVYFDASLEALPPSGMPPGSEEPLIISS
jgi:hypothetical protein